MQLADRLNRLCVATARNGKPVYQARPKEEWIATQVPVIVPREIFDQVQKRLEENGRHARRNARRDYLLSGLLKHDCGSRMGGRFNKGKVYYQCYKSLSHKAAIDKEGKPIPCDRRWVSGRNIEASVWDTVTDLLKHPRRYWCGG